LLKIVQMPHLCVYFEFQKVSYYRHLFTNADKMSLTCVFGV